jgi:hypothetical protein
MGFMKTTATKKLLKVTDLGEGCFHAQVLFVGRGRTSVKSDVAKSGRERTVETALRLAGVSASEVEDYATAVSSALRIDWRPEETIGEDLCAC